MALAKHHKGELVAKAEEDLWEREADRHLIERFGGNWADRHKITYDPTAEFPYFCRHCKAKLINLYGVKTHIDAKRHSNWFQWRPQAEADAPAVDAPSEADAPEADALSPNANHGKANAVFQAASGLNDEALTILLSMIKDHKPHIWDNVHQAPRGSWQ